MVEVIRAAVILKTHARVHTHTSLHTVRVGSLGALTLSHEPCPQSFQINRVSNEGCQMWAGQVSSPVRLERKEHKDGCKERATCAAFSL